MKRRVFVAVGISNKLRNEISAWQKSYQDLPVRWVKPNNLHITLIPPWYVTKVDGLNSHLKSCKNTVEPFTITFTELTFGPNPKKPRLIWANGEVPLEIITLKSKLEEVLQKKSEKRAFVTHLTIARFKEKDYLKFPVKSLNAKVLWEEKVSSFLLMESHLRRGGASYEILTDIKLKV